MDVRECVEKIEFDILDAIRRRSGRIGQAVDDHKVDFVVEEAVETFVQRLEPGEDDIAGLAVVLCSGVRDDPTAQVWVVAVRDPIREGIGAARAGVKVDRDGIEVAVRVFAAHEHDAGGP